MDPATLLPSVATLEPSKPNRQELFKTKCNSSKDKIFERVVSFTLAEIEKNLSPKQFNEIHVTAIIQKEISELDQRTGILFKLIVLDAYKDIVLKRKDVFQFLMGMSTFSGNPKFHSQYVNQVALPYFRELVADLNANLPGIIDEATSKGIPDEHAKVMQALKLE